VVTLTATSSFDDATLRSSGNSSDTGENTLDIATPLTIGNDTDEERDIVDRSRAVRSSFSIPHREDDAARRHGGVPRVRARLRPVTS